MAADNNNDAKRIQPKSNQGGGGGKGGKAQLNDAAASIHRASNISISNVLKKRRRLLSNAPAPAPRFIQAYDEYAYISDHEEEEREYLPKAKATRRRGGGNVVVVQKLQQQQQIQRYEQGQEQESAAKIEETKNEASALSIFAGRKRNARCYCFNCW